MKGLIFKDLMSLKREYAIFFLFFIAIGVIFPSIGGTDPSMFVCTGVVVVSTIMTSSFSYDEKCGFMEYGLTTPVKRKAYVGAKYILALINSIISSLCVLITTTVVSIPKGNVDIESALIISGIMLLVSLVIGVWEISLCMRFSSKTAGMMIFGFLAVAIMLIVMFIIIGFMVTSESHSSSVVPVVMGIFLIVLPVSTVVMFIKSFKWAERKEF